MDAQYKNLHLTRNQIQVLLQMHFLPYPIQIEGQPRLLLLSKQGFIMDIDLPSAERQKKHGTPRKKASSRGQAAD